MPRKKQALSVVEGSEIETVVQAVSKTRRRPARRHASAAPVLAASPADPSITMDPLPEPEPSSVPEPTPANERTHVIFSSKCRRCASMPGNINSILSVLVVLTVALSFVALSATVIIDSQRYQIDAFNHHSAPALRH
ncbi:hypothetical protein HYV73_01270 [Candidatus Uhrbacteria bacterium]|nr:hypothetical protein [Candidatus Uhrbacteria bacterium]